MSSVLLHEDESKVRRINTSCERVIAIILVDFTYTSKISEVLLHYFRVNPSVQSTGSNPDSD